MRNALINTATGAVLEWGAVDYVPGPGQSAVAIDDPGSFPEGVPNAYVKVVAGLFVAMTPVERLAVDLAIPRRRSQRVTRVREVLVSTNEASPGGGWGDLIPLTTTQPLLSGAYQIICGFELAMLDGSPTHTAQARLQVDGFEAATWANPRAVYNRCEFVATVALAAHGVHTLRLQVRRFGPGPGTARARHGSITISPAPPIAVELP